MYNVENAQCRKCTMYKMYNVENVQCRKWKMNMIKSCHTECFLNPVHCLVQVLCLFLRFTIYLFYYMYLLISGCPRQKFCRKEVVKKSKIWRFYNKSS